MRGFARLPRKCLRIVLIASGGLSGQAWAVNVPPGGSVTVNAGDPVTNWNLNAASLTVNPGGQTLNILTTAGSTVTLDGASVSATTLRALVLTESNAVISNSTLVSTGNTGLSVVRGVNDSAPGSTALVTNSSISAAGRGLNVSGGSTATLINSQVTGTGAVGGSVAGDGLGISLVGGEAILQGSQATGSNHGAGMFSNDASTATPHLVLTDGSVLTSGTGSAILVGSLGGPPMNADIEVRNSSSVVAANGVILEVGLATSPAGSTTGARFTVDNSQLTGDVQVLAGATADLFLNNAARLTGTITNAQSVSIDATSAFDMVNDSTVGALSLNGGNVNLGAGNAGFRTLTASSLTGAGTFVLRTDLAAHLSDLVNITGQASGNHTLSIQNSGADPIQEDHALQVVHTGGGTASFAVLGGQVDAGTFVYHLEQRDTDWFLVQSTTGGGSEGGDNGGGSGGGGVPIISPSTRAVIGVFSAAPTVWYGELSTLRSRMGELRNGQEQGGLWARTYGSRYQVSAQDQVHYQQTQQGISFGADTPLPVSSGQWLLGVMGGYSNSQLDMRLGTNGQVNSYYLGLYSTWLSDEGYYVDAILKANRFQNRADVRMSDGTKAKGDYDNYGVGGSVEAGKHIALTDGWFVEPYVQMSALWVEGEDYGLNNGLEAKSNKADSFLGKVGTHVGRTIPLTSGGFVQPYVKLAAAHEFARANEVQVNRTTFSDDLSGSRAELGAGIAAQLTQVLQVHADVDYSHGKNIEQPWGVSVGVRYLW